MIVLTIVLVALSAALYGVLGFFEVPHRLAIAAGTFVALSAIVAVIVVVAMDRPPDGAVPISRYEDEAG